MATLKEWAGGEHANLALVFTDIVDSTKIGNELKNEAMGRLRRDHFAQGERFLQQFQGRSIKTIGDSMMVAFKSVDKALEFARRFHENPGHPKVRIRVGIHVGIMDVQDEDLFGTNVNLAARVVGENKGEEIWLSQAAKDDLDHLGLERFAHLHYTPHAVTPKGFGPQTFWSLHTLPAPPSERRPSGSGPFKINTAKLHTVSGLLIGRERETQFLEDAWADPAVNAVQIVALGGTGKTALIDDWFRRHLNEAHTFAWSFYKQGAEKSAGASPDEFFNAALDEFEIPRPADASPVAKAKKLIDWMRRERTLLILDGVEPLQDDTGAIPDLQLKELVKELRTSNKGLLLCTTRQQIRELPDPARDARTLRLEDLSKESGAQLLKELGVHGTGQQREEASVRFGNQALAVTLLGTYLAEFHNGDIRRITDVKELLEVNVEAGRHAKRVMASYAEKFKDRPERELLCALGYFDRPAELEAIRIVLGGDPDPKPLAELRRLRLIYRGDPYEPLDCHPLIRDYFRSVVKQEHPEEFKKIHSALFEHYKATEPEFPDTVEQMRPLFWAVYHGCQADRHQEACSVYQGRILRGDQFYLTRTLSEWSLNLSLLSNFFLDPWSQPVPVLKRSAQSWLFGVAGHTFQSLGRLQDAVATFQTGAERRLREKDWKGVARSCNTLSEVHVSLGNLAQAIETARKSLDHADRVSDGFEPYLSRPYLAAALHKAGQLAEAEILFKKAGEMAAKYAADEAFLASLWAYRYCAILLDQGKNAEVLYRATGALKFAERSERPLNIGLNHLSLGQAHPAGSPESLRELDLAILFLRKAAYQYSLCLGLLARATEADLQEAFEIATRSEMRLVLADYHLIQAKRLQSKDHYQQARQLIEATGYHRRDKDLRALAHLAGR